MKIIIKFCQTSYFEVALTSAYSNNLGFDSEDNSVSDTNLLISDEENILADLKSSKAENSNNLSLLINYDLGQFKLVKPPVEKLLISELNADQLIKFQYDIGAGHGPKVGHKFASPLFNLYHHNRTILQNVFNKNLINIVVPTYLSIFIKEILSPFYIFQVAACVLWYTDEYVLYATSIVVITLTGILLTMISVRKEKKHLQTLVYKHNKVPELRYDRFKNKFLPCLSTDLVVGDIIQLDKHNMTDKIITADMILLDGTAIIDESLLTGESAPVTKVSIESILGENSGNNAKSKYFDENLHKNHILYCGTTLIQCRNLGNRNCLALVIKTGFWTAKGQLIRSILYPKPSNLRLMEDSLKFVYKFVQLACLTLVYSITVLIMRGATLHEIILKPLDMITVAVPPALPAATAVGMLYAVSRLKKLHQIYCVAPNRINIAGQVNKCVFDKTGTLTEDCLTLKRQVIRNSGATNLEENPTQEDQNLFTLCKASCHTLTKIANQIRGDPLDLEMYKKSGYLLIEPSVEENQTEDSLDLVTIKNPVTNTEYAYLKQIPFTSADQRMLVVISNLDTNKKSIFCKGAPEKIAKLCKNLPEDYFKKLKSYSSEGYRVIALAGKSTSKKWVQIQKLKRNQLEKDLNFLGFLLLENTLKSETKPTIQLLQNADIDSIMATGDNLDTAIAVGRQCGMVKPHQQIFILTCEETDHEILAKLKAADSEDQTSSSIISSAMSSNIVLAASGNDFQAIYNYFPEYSTLLAKKLKILARMKPHHKQFLIELLMDEDFTVAMCGDGSNDCAALKSAHVGISLSELEASVAAPFTSKVDNITCIFNLLREGRCSLTTSIGLFKYILMYAWIQIVTVSILYYLNYNLADFQYLYIDMIIIDSFCLTMSLNGAYHTLTKEKPTQNLLSGKVLVSMGFQIFLTTLFQIGFYLLMTATMKCYFDGFVGYEDQRTTCGCTFITNPNDKVHPEYVPEGNYTYLSLEDSLFMIFEPETFHCQNQTTDSGFYDDHCKVTFNLQKKYNFNEVVLPKIDQHRALASLDKQSWLDLCTVIEPPLEDDFIYGIHYNVVKAYPVTILFYYSILQYISIGFR